MVINVTGRHIAGGKRSDCNYCPIALAFKEAGLNIQVGSYFIHRSPDDLENASELPNAVCDFIRKFDRGQPVQPFSFEINL